MKRTDFEGFEDAAEKSALKAGSFGEVMFRAFEGVEPWNCDDKSENCARKRSSESA